MRLALWPVECGDGAAGPPGRNPRCERSPRLLDAPRQAGPRGASGGLDRAGGRRPYLEWRRGWRRRATGSTGMHDEPWAAAAEQAIAEAARTRPWQPYLEASLGFRNHWYP